MIKDNWTSGKFTLAVALATMGGITPAFAQTPAPAADAEAGATSSDGRGVEEIVVTAQFRAQNLQRTPVAITAMSADMLNARSETNLSAVAGQAPNVTLSSGNSNLGPTLVASIRGIGQSDFSPAVEPGVGIYVDDVYYPTLTGSIMDLLDLDRIEVSRGPQGTLAGRNSIGGAIKLYSKRPGGEDGGVASVTYGSRHRIDLRGSANIALADDLGVRFAAVSKTQHGYIKDLDFGCVNQPGTANNPAVGGIAPRLPVDGNCVLSREGDVNYQAVRGQIRYNPGSVVDINLAADYTHDSRNPSGAVLTYANNPATGGIRGQYQSIPYDSRFICGRFCTYSSFLMPADPANGFTTDMTRNGQSFFEGWGVSGQVDLNLANNLKLTSITAYRKYVTNFNEDDDQSPLYVSSTQNLLNFHFFSQELRLNGQIGKLIDYTVGGYYSSQNTTQKSQNDLRYASLQILGGAIVPAHTKAAFAHAALHLTDRLTLIGGIRFTAEDKKYTYIALTPDGSAPHPRLGNLNGLNQTYKGQRVDYRAVAQYQVTDNVMAYTQFSTGFRGGGVNPRAYFASQVVPFGPESVNAYEAGLKTDLFDHRARFNLSAFYNDYSDIQLVLRSCPQYSPPGLGYLCALPANAGDAHVKGIELETTLKPIDGLLIDGSISYLNFKYTYLNPAVTLPGGVQYSDVSPYTPKWKWSVGAQYAFALGNGDTVTPRIDATYQSTLYTSAPNRIYSRLPSYTVANARISWRNEAHKLEISGEVTNLFNKYYLLNTLDNSTGAGYATAKPARPREWALTVTKRF